MTQVFSFESLLPECYVYTILICAHLTDSSVLTLLGLQPH